MEIRYHPDNDQVLRRLAEGRFDAKEWFDLRVRAEELALTRGFERLISLDSTGLQLYDHQQSAVLKVLQEMRGRAVLADEVGLGKTIEAGVILKEYLLRGLVRKVLILVPAPLVTQWREELAIRLGVACHINDSVEGWGSHDQIIASLDTAKRSEHAREIHGLKWDLVIVDEAHRLKNRATVNWRFVNRIQKKYLLLLTATPVQNDLRELYNMITLLKPGQLKTYRVFKREFMVDKRSPKNVGRLRRLLDEVMVRSTRRDTLLRFPKRQVYTEEVHMGQREQSFYDRVLATARQAYHSAPRDEANLLPLVTLLREACSSAAAARSTLEVMFRRESLPGVSATDLADLVAGAAAAEQEGSKVHTLLRVLQRELDSPGEQAIVFTEFRATLDVLAGRLGEAGISAVAFHGGLTTGEKDAAVDKFRRGGQVLLSTEAGGEGRNLQFCRMVVNFDLPWNPMRIEQRIGRVHRLGQTRDVVVVNMTTTGTVEAYVLYLLDKKINMFQRVIGDLDVVLAQLDTPFEHHLAQLILGSPEEEVPARVEGFGRTLAEAAQTYRQMMHLNARLLDTGTGEADAPYATPGALGSE